MQMKIITAGKIIELIFFYRAINLFIDYRDRPTHTQFTFLSPTAANGERTESEAEQCH